MTLTTRLYVANLNFETSENDFFEHFTQYGKVKKAQIITDRETGESRGFGFVEMDTPIDAERALSAAGTSLDGRTLKVSYAREKERK